MISIGANGEKITYGIKHYNVDTEEDKQTILKSSKKKMGCTCYVINTAKYYMLNSDQQWVEMPMPSSGGSSGGGGSDTPIDPNNTYIYDGGLII